MPLMLLGGGAGSAPVPAGAVAADADHQAVPTLCRTKWDDVFVLYHTPDFKLRICLTTDLGEVWTDWATLTNLNFQYPRAVIVAEAMYIVFYHPTSGNLRVVRSDDYGLTFDGAPSAIRAFTSAEGVHEAQLASLRVDRHGILHLVWYDSVAGALKHSWTQDHPNWSAPATLLSIIATGGVGGTPTYAPGLGQAGVTYYEKFPSGNLQPTFSGTEEDFTVIDADTLEPGPAAWTFPGVTVGVSSDIPQQYYGLLFDRRDWPWICLRDAGGTIRTYASADAARTWTLLPG